METGNQKLSALRELFLLLRRQDDLFAKSAQKLSLQISKPEEMEDVGLFLLLLKETGSLPFGKNVRDFLYVVRELGIRLAVLNDRAVFRVTDPAKQEACFDVIKDIPPYWQAWLRGVMLRLPKSLEAM